MTNKRATVISDMGDVIVEASENRLKVVIPIRVNWFLLALFTVALVVWLGMLLAVLSYLFRGLSSSVVLTAILIIWIAIWLWFGRFLTSRWQYQAADREILFIEDEQLIIRRPVSIFGLTTSYDRQHATTFYFSEKHRCPAFDYAFHHVYFGRSLDEQSAMKLIDMLNNELYPESEYAE